jgi:hypothetical protein
MSAAGHFRPLQALLTNAALRGRQFRTAASKLKPAAGTLFSCSAASQLYRNNTKSDNLRSACLFTNVVGMRLRKGGDRNILKNFNFLGLAVMNRRMPAACSRASTALRVSLLAQQSVDVHASNLNGRLLKNYLAAHCQLP